MMFGACLAPRALELPDTPEGQADFALAVSLLRDLEENCVVLVDDDPAHVTTAAITAAVNLWPHRYRTAIKELLQRLRQRNRFVALPAGAAPSCGANACRFAIGIATSGRPDVTVVADRCAATVGALLSGIPVLTLRTYPASKFADERAKARSQAFAKAALSASTAEQRVFGPMMQYAKHLTLIDRYIGRSVPGKGQGRASFGADYQRSLEWLCRMFAAGVSGTPRAGKATCEIYCGIESGLSASDVSDAVKSLRAWEARMVAAGIPGFRLFIKQESYAAEIPHARYLLTDQASFLVERGFDLLFSDAQIHAHGPWSGRPGDRPMRDCVVAVCPDAAAVKLAVRRLPDL